MKTKANGWATAALLATVAGCGQQEREVPLRRPEHPKPQRRDLYPPLETTYDEFTDVTSTSSYIKLRGHLRLRMSAYASGKAPTPIRMADLVITEDSASWQHLRPSLILIVDGERMIFDKLTHDGNVGLGHVFELVTARLTLEQLTKLAHAKSIRGRLDLSEFEIPPDGIDIMRGFAVRVGVLESQDDSTAQDRPHPVHQKAVILRESGAAGLPEDSEHPSIAK